MSPTTGETPSPVATGGRSRPGRWWGLAALGAGLLLACTASVAVGSRTVPLAEVWQALTDPSVHTFSAEAVRSRVPRTLLGLVAGASLAVSGALLQALTRNPLADPGILGVNSGAAVMVVIGMAWFGLTSATQYVWLALAGAAGAAALVWGVGTGWGRSSSPLRLALSGAVLTAVLTGIIQAVLLPRADLLQVFRTWQAGGIDSAATPQVLGVLPLILLGGVGAALSGRALNALALGDELATGLGTRVGLVRLLVGGSAVTLAGATTALTGPIGFVGLVVPHGVRAVVGPDNRWVIAWSLAAGPLLLLLADVVGRVLTKPSDVQVGIITALVGAPVFIAMTRRRRIGEL